jgi:hypothetical protein
MQIKSAHQKEFSIRQSEQIPQKTTQDQIYRMMNPKKNSIDDKNYKRKKQNYQSQDSNEQATLQSIKSGDLLVGKFLSPANLALRNRSSGTAMSGASIQSGHQDGQQKYHIMNLIDDNTPWQ